MKVSKQAQLKAHGWAVGDTQTFLGLSDEKSAFIELKLALPPTSGGDSNAD